MYKLNLLVKLMVLLCQILFNLAVAAIATQTILMWISAEQEPFLHRVAPRELKLVTSSNFWPFMLSALTLFVLSVMFVLFSVLISTPFAVALSWSLLMKS